jgi:predicted dehydrogenase
MTPVRAVLVGCGVASLRWVEPVRDMNDVEIVGFVDILEENARKRAEDYGTVGTLATTDFSKAIDQLHPDAVFCCTTPESHYPIVMESLRKGCHVLEEKPLADSMEHAHEMVAMAERTGLVLSVIQNRRYDPEIRRVRRVIADGTLGSLTTLNGDFYIGAHFGGFRDHMDHVLLLDMAIHSFDQARYISGADPVAVYCHEWNPAGSWYDHDASAVAIFEMTGGIVYTYRGSWCSEGLHTTWECDWRAVGPTGSLRWDGARDLRIELATGSDGFLRETETVAPPEHDPGAKVGARGGLIREFVDCIRNAGVPETAASDNIKSLAMVFGAIESAQTGRRVEIIRK